MSRLPDPGPLPRPFGTYQLVRRIAVGGMAEVYVGLARGVGGFEKLVALKLIHPGYSEDPHFIRMLVDEAKLSVLLTDANIAQTFDLGVVDGRYYIVMEYVDGVDAARLLDLADAKRVRLPIPAALYVMTKVCQALDYAHRKTDISGSSLGVIHRDVSPQNVLLSYDGEVKLADFGIAKAALRTTETEVGVIKGKYCYMSPEQAWADPIDHRSDIFSAGAVMHELLTGHMLFSPNDNLPALLERVRKADVRPPSTFRPEIPLEIDSIVMKALARQPGDRYETAAEFGEAIERALFHLDRGWGAAKLQKLMRELAPVVVDDVAAITPSAEKPGGTAVTRVEGLHTKMNSREFMPETSSSVLFGESGDAFEKARNSDPDGLRERKRPSHPATVREVVARGESGKVDPRVESPARRAHSDEDDEDEATTFFQRPALDLDVTIDVDESRPDDDATLVDKSGDLAKALEELRSTSSPLGPRTDPVPRHFDRDEEDVAKKVVAPFPPPAPRWKSLPFVGPPLEPGEITNKASARAKAVPAVPMPVLLAAALGALLIFAAIVYAAR